MSAVRKLCVFFQIENSPFKHVTMKTIQRKTALITRQSPCHHAQSWYKREPWQRLRHTWDTLMKLFQIGTQVVCIHTRSCKKIVHKMKTISPARSILKRCKFQLPELIVDTMPCTVSEIGENLTQNLTYTLITIPINLKHKRKHKHKQPTCVIVFGDIAVVTSNTDDLFVRVKPFLTKIFKSELNFLNKSSNSRLMSCPASSSL